MPDDANVTLSSGLPETILPAAPAEVLADLETARSQPADQRRAAVAAVAAAHPRLLEAWATLGELTADPVEAYAYFRVGYHRGLDALRQSGWRGSGYVRWSHPTNQGVLRSLEGLRRQAAAIGELDEAQRCEQFLHQLDPDWPPPSLA